MTKKNCTWGHENCINFGNSKCDMCFSENFYYQAKKIKNFGLAKRQAKPDKRQGSAFEYSNHKKNTQMIKEASSSMTPNSGAGKIKGDEQITGIIKIMEELKTREKKQAPGSESFTIKKNWLEKLRKEAEQENKEFWYLKFSFHKYDNQTYVLVEEDLIMSMVKTMIHDRQNIDIEKIKTKVAENRMQLAETQLLTAKREIELLKSELSLIKKENSYANR